MINAKPNSVELRFDYDPFGMMMSGRNWDAGSGYRYGFNGQEQDDEVEGNGNINTAQYWEYDIRLGRRWNLDPKATNYFSSYSALNDNPILNIDAPGDSSVYYNQKGDLLYKDLNDGLSAGIVIVESETTFNLILQKSKEASASVDPATLNRLLRLTGTTYNYNDISKLGKEKVLDTETTNRDASDVDKQALQYMEVSSFLYLINGEVRVGFERFYSSGEGGAQGLPRWPSLNIGRIHSHINEGLEVYTLNEDGSGYDLGTYDPGPSKEVDLSHEDNDIGYYNVIVSPTRIDFYNFKNEEGSVYDYHYPDINIPSNPFK